MDYKRKAKELVAQMTLEEKIGQMSHSAPPIERLGIPAYNWWNEGLHGVGRAGTATVFPQAIGLAATFDKQLMFRVATAISDEFRAKYNAFSSLGDFGIYKGLTVWSPNINIFRDPRWGRGHETYGEDPVLTSRMAVNFVKGLQGTDPLHHKTDATLKHFVAHSGPESVRHTFHSQVSRKDFYETYAYAFAYTIRNAKPAAVMGAYNGVNGEECVASKHLIEEILRGQFGFDGYYVSDCGAVCDLFYNRGKAKDLAEAAACAANAGCDLCCGTAYHSLLPACDKGLVREETLTKSVERLMEARLHLGMGQKTVYDAIPYDKVACGEHRRLALDAAVQSTVLLKNDGILPLKNKNITVSVCGPNAHSTDVLVGNYNGTPYHDVTMLEGIFEELKETGRVLYSRGCDLTKPEDPQDRMITEALIHAKYSDVVVACVGLSPRLEGEEGDAFNSDAGGDKKTLALPQSQREFLRQLYQTGKPIVVVNLSGSAILLNEENEKANAVLQMFYPGERGGEALAQILFGEKSPGGKLPVTFYADDAQIPDFTNYSMKGRTYKYLSDEPLYPFGYGLSYGDISFSVEDWKLDGKKFTARVTLQNHSRFRCEETVMLFSRRCFDAGTGSPNFKLCDFETAPLSENGTAAVTLQSDEGFDFWNENGEVENCPGDYELFIGTSQPDERSRELTGKPCFKITLRR